MAPIGIFMRSQYGLPVQFFLSKNLIPAYIAKSQKKKKNN